MAKKEIKLTKFHYRILSILKKYGQLSEAEIRQKYVELYGFEGIEDDLKIN